MAENCCFVLNFGSGGHRFNRFFQTKPSLCRHLCMWTALAMVAGILAVMPPVVLADTDATVTSLVVLKDIDFRVAHPYPKDSDWAALARALVDLKAGDVLTQEKLAQALEKVDAIGQVEATLDEDRLVFVLAPFRRIKSMRFRGNYPLFEQEVRDVMTLRVGMVFKPEALAEQRSLIAERFKSEGYIDPGVRIDWRQDPDDGHYFLSVTIEKGDYFTIGRFRMSGNRSFPESLLKAKMASWRTMALWAGQSRFAQDKFKQDIDKLLAYYRKQGFADAAVTYTLTPDVAEQQMHVDIVIDEGLPYRITFTGNSEFLDYTLRKDLELFELGNRGNIGLRRSIQNIRRRYLRAGYADVRVTWESADAGPEQADAGIQGKGSGGEPARTTARWLQLMISEGLRHQVRSVTIKGAHFFSEEKIKDQMLTRPQNGWRKGVFDTQVLGEDLASIQALYQKYGFIHARIQETVDIHPSDKSVAIILTIEEGRQVLVGRIAFEGPAPVEQNTLREALQLKPGDPFQPDRVRLDESELAARIAPHGYPHVRVEARVAQDESENRAHITYRIATGPYVQVGAVVFAGNFRTRDPILARELEFESGDPFSLADVLAAQRNLRSTGLFETVQVRTIGLKEMESIVHLLFLTVEKKPYFFELGGGYDTSKGLYARTKTGDHNFLGTDKDIWTGGEIAETGWRWDAGISNPRLFGSRVQADMGGYIERQENFNQDFGVDSAGSTISLSRRWPRSITTYLAWRYERRQQFLREQDASQNVDPQALDPRSNLVTTPTLVYDNRDSFIRPHRGWLANLSLDLSNGLDNDLDDFARYKADLRVYHPLHPDLTLAGMVRMGYIVAFGENADIPEDQLFFLGGTLDVRGYKENLLQFDTESDPVGGRLALSASVEARYDIGYHLELAAFVDAGRLQMTLDDAQEDEWRWTTGLGLRYQTPIGPIGLLYGHKIDPRPGESRGQFHFTIGYTF